MTINPSASLFTFPRFQAFNTAGSPLAGGQLYSYAAGTLTPQATYTDSSLTIPNPNPVILDAFGTASVWLGNNAYKINLLDVNGVQQANFPMDNISSISTNLAASTTISQGQGLVGFNSTLSYPLGTLPGDLSDTTNIINGDALIGVLQPFTGAVARTQHNKNLDLVSLTDFVGADPTGATNSDTALQAAINYGEFLVPKGTFVISTAMLVNNNVSIVGVGMNESIIKQVSGANCNLFSVNGDYRLQASGVQFDGNGSAQTSAAGTTDGFAVPIGSLVLDHCYLHDFKCNIIRTGNVESTFGFPFSLNQYAHDLVISHCIFAQASYFNASTNGTTLTLNTVPTGSFTSGATILIPTANGQQPYTLTLASGTLGAVGSTYNLSGSPGTIIDAIMCLSQGYGDCIRMFKVTRAVVENSFFIGGLSPIRGCYYSSFVRVSNNFATLTGDVGVTLALTTDSVINGNVCTFNAHNGIEEDSCHRIAITGNTCSYNTNRGIHSSTYAPPGPTGVSLNGYFDGQLAQYSVTASLPSSSNQLSITASTGTTILGMYFWAGTTNLSYVTSVTNNGVAPCIATLSVTNGSTAFPSQGMIATTTFPNQDVVISGNTVNGNGYSGMWATGTLGTTVTGNRISGNNTTNANGEGGIYLYGDATNEDFAQITDNDFNNTGYQTVSIQRGNAQLSPLTRISGNRHIGGQACMAYPAVGSFNAASDRFLLNSSSIASGTSSIVEDTAGRTGFCRQVASGATCNFQITNLTQYGQKLIYIRIRTPDGMPNCAIYVNLVYNGGASLYTAATLTPTLTSAWAEYCLYLPASLKSYTYNQLQISAQAGASGHLNLEEISCFLPVE